MIKSEILSEPTYLDKVYKFLIDLQEPFDLGRIAKENRALFIDAVKHFDRFDGYLITGFYIEFSDDYMTLKKKKGCRN